jgi:putative NADPH-quinone reductase
MCRSLADIWEEQLKAAGVDIFREEIGGSEGNSLSLAGAGELKAALTGKDPDGKVSEEVRRLQGLVESCQFLIFVHPIFWFEVPSQLKAFQESVLSSGFAFRKLPGHWLLNRAATLASKLPLAPRLLRRYAAYGLLRDKRVFITRTMGGPVAGLAIFDHGATSLESSLQFCGAHLAGVDTLGELDDTSSEELLMKVLPQAKNQIKAHCQQIARLSVASVLPLSLLNKSQQAALRVDAYSNEKAVGA